MILLFAFTSFLSLCVLLANRRSSNTHVLVIPNYTVNYYNGRFGGEREPIVPNSIRPSPYRFSRIYRYGAPGSPNPTNQDPGLNKNRQQAHAGSSTVRPDTEVPHSSPGSRRWRPSNIGNSRYLAPVPESRESPGSGLPRPDTWRTTEVPSTSQHFRFGNFTNLNHSGTSNSRPAGYRGLGAQHYFGTCNHVRPASGAPATPTSAPVATDASLDVPPPYTPFQRSHQ